MTLEDGTKYLFGVLCFVSAGVGTYLQVLSGDLLARSLLPDKPTWPNLDEDHTLVDVLARGQRARATAVGARVSRLSALVLYLSVATGLVINFPTIALASVGMAATIAMIIWCFALLRDVPGLDRRIRVFEGLQRLHSMRHGNVVAQNATIEFDKALAMTDEELKRAEPLIQRLLNEEQQIIDERNAQRQAKREPEKDSTEPPQSGSPQ